METWRYCYICGFKKPAEGMKRTKINGKYRVICKNCHEDLTTGYISYPKLAGQEMK